MRIFAVGKQKQKSMRKVLHLVLFFSMAVSGVARAQYVSLYTGDTTKPDGTQTIVRGWDTTHTISYYIDSDKRPILDVTEQSSGWIRRAILPNDIFFRDIFIDQATDILYFCGATTMYNEDEPYTGDGIIGWVDLNSFYYSNINIKYYYVSVVGDTLNSVNKLVVYNDGGVPHIVAIGERQLLVGNVLQSRYYFLSCLDVSGISPSCVVGSFSNNERYDNVLLTLNYIVFIGYDSSSTVKSVCYRKADPWNFPGPVFDHKHYFVNGNDPITLTLSTSVYKGLIATTYLAMSNSDLATRVRVIDVDSDNNVSSQEYVVHNVEKPEGIVYMPFEYPLVLMQKFRTPTNGVLNTNFVFLDLYPRYSYTATLEYLHKVFFQSLSMHKYKCYLAGDGATWFLKDKTLSPTNTPHSQCPDTDRVHVKTIDNLRHQDTPFYLWHISDNWNRTDAYSRIINSFDIIKCYNQ